MEGGSSEDKSQAADGSMKLVEIKIKTLDSQVYTCNVDQNMSVPALKERVETLTGVPVENQRLICRGKVLKDDHNLSAYNVEDGHTLHLVTRQVPQTGATSASAGSSGGEEEQGGDDPSSHRPPQISHSVVMGTFNVPDNGDGGLPDVNMIISSVLSSLGMANLAPNAGANVSGAIGVTANPAPAVPGQDLGIGNGRPQSFMEFVNQIQPSVAQATLPATASGFLPGIEQQFRLLQPAMVIPDALTTISQYLDGLEQALASNGQHASPAHATSSVGSPPGHPTPAHLGALIWRTIRLLNGPGGVELERLSSQLVSEPNMNDVRARGELQSAALRDGVLLQHLGALLLELGRATLTLRMGASAMESAVNAGPAVFISPAGPNPIMVQPLPYQPGEGVGARHNAPVVSFGEVPRNVNIHIHANDAGASRGFSAPGLRPNNIPPQVSSAILTTEQGSSNETSAVHAIAMPMQASNTPEQLGVRVFPMRTVVAAMPGRPIVNPIINTSGAHPNILHPLLARLQRLNPQQAGSQQAVSLQGPPPGSSTVAPSIQAQVQVQACVPDGQGGTRLVRNEEALQTFFTPAMTPASLSAAQVQPSAQDIGAVNASNQTTNTSHNRPAGQQVPAGDVPADGAGRNEATKVASSKAEVESSHSAQGKDEATSSQSEARRSLSLLPQVAEIEPRTTACLGVSGLQPLPSRTARQQQGTEVAGTSVHDQADVKSPDERGLARSGGPPSVSDANRNLRSHTLPAPQFVNNVPSQRDDAGNLDLGSWISQLMGGTPLSSRARETGDLHPGALGNLLGQVLQNPFCRNVVQQVLEQLGGEGALEEDDPAAQGAHTQTAGLDISRLLQDMMPLVSQGMNRLSTTEQTSGRRQGSENGGNVASHSGVASIQGIGVNVSDAENLPVLSQQMMLVIPPSFGGSRWEQPLSAGPSSVEARGTADADDHQLEDMLRQEEDGEQAGRQEDGVQSERQGGVPIAKRLKKQ